MVSLLRMAAAEQGKLNTGMRRENHHHLKTSFGFSLGVPLEQNSGSIFISCYSALSRAVSGGEYRQTMPTAREELFPTNFQGWAQGPFLGQRGGIAHMGKAILRTTWMTSNFESVMRKV